ncbi:MAG TPA: VCBS repeat-containing protein, partial [Pyrinomonadaceae bacterium]|nr:VCBS repeat-containing protein [Pyrinomonadaceae bacterium]
LRTFTFGISLVVEKPVMGDFDGDGCTDVALTRNVGGEQLVMIWYILKSNHGAYNQYTSLQFGVPGDLPAAGDFDGDGKSDVAVFRPANGTWYIFRSGSGQVQVTQFGSNGDKPQPGDFDGDGKADLGVFRPSEGNWYMWLSGSDTQKIIRWGLSTDIPVATMNSLSQ